MSTAIKTFEYGQQVIVKGYRSHGVVVSGNRHQAEYGIDTVSVEINGMLNGFETANVEATGAVLERCLCRTQSGWKHHWVVENILEAKVEGETLHHREIDMYGRDVAVYVPESMAALSTDDILDDMIAQGGDEQ